jgi:hypothetical protein
MDGGEISGNSAYDGGGVYLSGGMFTMSGGEISGNSASNGGGVYEYDATFTMSGGVISGNSVSASFYGNGGGVNLHGTSTFTMSGGVISGNSVSDPGNGGGGGVQVTKYCRFAKTSGTIYGFDPEDQIINSNVVKSMSGILRDNKGHAVFVSDTANYKGIIVEHKETTSGPDDNLVYRYPTDSDISGW